MVVTRTTRNRFVLNRARGFESHHLRQGHSSSRNCDFLFYRNSWIKCIGPPFRGKPSGRAFGHWVSGTVPGELQGYLKTSDSGCQKKLLGSEGFQGAFLLPGEHPGGFTSQTLSNRLVRVEAKASSCAFVRFGLPLGCLPARRSFLFSYRRSMRASMLSAVYSKPF